uniref:EamA domain-containing protein n=1 Tax=Eucampia antarctica TaxID=49252 RepID=A0A6U0SYC7_9STRA|mmetsp:Transcript_30586/g.29497  ORF Transcript_30586/g.29497 Transcript_30586/m.29497 type:complete len:436 (+) Transcript_30586:71-1378(+)
MIAPHNFSLFSYLILCLIPCSISFSCGRNECKRVRSPSILAFRTSNNCPSSNQFQHFSVLKGTSTEQDELVENPASMVYYDDVINDSSSEGVVCARGVCAIVYDEDEAVGKDEKSLVDKVLNSYLGPRALLAGASILYGTNFPLGAIMNESLPPSAATAARMVLASIALSPFLFKLNRSLAGSALLCGSFTSLGYITQSLSLVDTSPAKVAFLGAVTVIVCPTLEFLVDKKPMGIKDAPQIWLAATLCLFGVGILELYDPSGSIGMDQVGSGDFLAILQAIGFGTSFFLTERMMRGQPDQALPITAVQVSVTAFLCMIWCFIDGWIGTEGSSSYALPNLFFDNSLQIAAGAVAWTGLVTTAMNRFVETTALGKVSSAEASVILATEPLWAALFAAIILSENFGINDYVGGALIVLACLANALKPSDFDRILGEKK